MKNEISIINAKEHNLKNISVKLPKNKFVVITGVSGSGKSSLAFDVLYTEGKRRYVESLSTYARQFLGNAKRPDVESIDGLSPAIAIDQKTTSHNPRSTVGTVTEIQDYYRLLFARIGIAYCPVHKEPITAQSITEIARKVYKENSGKMIQILSPIIEEEKGTHKALLEKLKEEGFLRIKVDGEVKKLTEKIELSKNKKHTISIVVDNILVDGSKKNRIFEAIEVATTYSDNLVLIQTANNDEPELYSKNFACKHGDFEMPNIEPRLFSFNSHIGACHECNGIGSLLRVTWESIADDNLSVQEGGIKFFKPGEIGMDYQKFISLLKHFNIPTDKKVGKLTKQQREIIMYGSQVPISISLVMKQGKGKWETTQVVEGVAQLIERRYENSTSDRVKDVYMKYLTNTVCKSCNGDRLNEHALAVQIHGLNIAELSSLSIKDTLHWFNHTKFTPLEEKVSTLILGEIRHRLEFLNNVGLGYLTMNRLSMTLSGGESQRIRLASQMGSKLTGVLYVLDEPSIGLHQSDNMKLINSLKDMRDLGNTVVVVEHDEETILESDYIIDMGPGAGEFGGEVVGVGTPNSISKLKTHTGRFLSGKDKIERTTPIRKGNGKFLEIIEAQENNLKNINVKFPLGKFIAITGVSGSGKSTLVNDILYKALHTKLIKDSKKKPGKHKDFKGYHNIDKIVQISQNPIGRTSRSNPATYTSVFDDIRKLFAEIKDSKVKGYEIGRFSFNVPGGRCEKCHGDGTIKISMHFLPDIYVTCDECHGSRYNEETLSIKYKGYNIHDVLEMSVDEALKIFENIPKIKHKLTYLHDVGLGYIRLGHPAPLLSGGEAQRVKLATHLQKKPTGKTLYILDEPTTGLHNYDVKILLKTLNKIVDHGDTIIVIEHNIDVIKMADHIIDLGPNGGDEGGEIVAQGTPKEVKGSKKSLTGKYL